VCEGWLRPGGTFCVPGTQAGVYRRVFLAARPGMTALPETLRKPGMLTQAQGSSAGGGGT